MRIHTLNPAARAARSAAAIRSGRGMPDAARRESSAPMKARASGERRERAAGAGAWSSSRSRSAAPIRSELAKLNTGISAPSHRAGSAARIRPRF